MVLAYKRGEPVAEFCPLGENIVGAFGHLGGEYVEQIFRDVLLLEQFVALHQQLVVVLQVSKVVLVGLRKEHIDEAAALAAGLIHQNGVGRRGHNDGYQTDMVRESFVLFLAAANLLRTLLVEQHGDCLLSIVSAHVCALHRGRLLSVPEREAVDGVEVALGHRQVVDGVEQVGLSLAVVPVDAVQPLRKLNLSFRNVLEIREADPLEVHRYKGTQMSAEKPIVGEPPYVYYGGCGSNA